MLSPIATVFVALLAQAPASATASTPPAPPAHEAPAPAVVCRSVDETGSRFTHRVCHTPAEWQAISAAASDSVSKMQQQGAMTGGPH